MTTSFFLSVVGAYAAACGGWIVITRGMPGLWPTDKVVPSRRPNLDMILALLTAVLVLGIGQVYRAGWLLPEPDGSWRWIVYNLNMIIIYSPVFVLLVVRKQSAASIYLSPRGMGVKLLIGVVLGIFSVTVYLLMRGEMSRFNGILSEAVRPQALTHFLAVFLEGAGLAFLFERIRWAFGLKVALLVPAALFAAAHVPRQLDSDDTIGEMAAYFVLNTSVAAGVLLILYRSKDVCWIGVVHYLMDNAIRAFD